MVFGVKFIYTSWWICWLKCATIIDTRSKNLTLISDSPWNLKYTEMMIWFLQLTTEIILSIHKKKFERFILNFLAWSWIISQAIRCWKQMRKMDDQSERQTPPTPSCLQSPPPAPHCPTLLCPCGPDSSLTQSLTNSTEQIQNCSQRDIWAHPTTQPASQTGIVEI